MPRLNKAVVSLTLMFLLSSVEQLRAELFLGVDFDINQAGVQSNAIVDSNGKTTAYIVLYLSGSTNLYAYEFSVRYNSDRLTLDSKDDNPPSVVNGKTFTESQTLDHSSFGSGGGFANYVEINRFDGKIVDPNDVLVIDQTDIPGGLVLGVLNFTVRGTGEDLLIMPGLFEAKTNFDALPYDSFLGNISSTRFEGGTITSVPEPSSMLFVAALALILTITQQPSIRRRLAFESHIHKDV